MDFAHAGLKQQPFDKRGEPGVFVHYQSQQAAHSFLQMVTRSSRGIGLLYGPESSGKATIMREFVRGLPADLPVAIVSGARLNTAELLDAINREFAIQTESRSPDVALIELEEFLVRQARDGRVSLLVVNDLNKMYPSALRILCRLAAIKSRGQFAVRMVLVSGKPSFNIVHAPAMTAIAARTFSAFELGPMTGTESQRYLYAKLRASGCASPHNVFPAEICSELYTASRGWPGILDSLAMRAIERARNWPIEFEDIYPPAAQPKQAIATEIAIVQEDAGPEVQKLYLTLNRKTLQEFEIRDSKILIGRSAICDISISSRFVSKHHALLIRRDDSMHLVDLNSTNGTFVNSRRVQSTALQHDDVISLGNHGIKLIAPAYRARPAGGEPDLSDTTTMKTLDDLRDLRDEADSESVPAENR